MVSALLILQIYVEAVTVADAGGAERPPALYSIQSVHPLDLYPLNFLACGSNLIIAAGRW